jgi:hypothetical protein
MKDRCLPLALGRLALPRTLAPAVVLATMTMAATGCGPDSLALPPAPDMDALVAAYQTPTASIDPTQLAQIMSNAQMTLAQLHLDWLPDLMAQALVQLRARLANGGLPDDPTQAADTDRPAIDAVIVLTQICRGWDDPPGPPDAAQNGTLQVTAVVEDGRARRTFAGTATACHALLQPTNAIVASPMSDIKALIAGTINVYFYDRLPMTVQETNVLVQITGQLGTMDAGISGSFDFQLIYPNVEVRLTRPDGELILSVGLDGVTIRGANGSYHCDVALQTCAPA